jgi:hypothetical protein
MPTFKLVQQGQSVESILKKYRQSLGDARDEFLIGMAAEVVLRSPVDTGTYMEGHTITTGGSVPKVDSSKNKPRSRPYQPFAQAAMNRMASQIRALPKDVPVVSISNSAIHSDLVEYSYGYAPYSQARNEASRIAIEAVNKVKP